MTISTVDHAHIENRDLIKLPVTPEIKARFAAQGFLALERITSDADIAFIRDTLERLFADRSGYEEGAFFDFAGAGDEDGIFKLPQLLDPRSFAPALVETEFFRNGLAVAKELLGKDTTFAADHALVKPAMTGGLTPWHQDEAFHDPELHRDAISIWMPLQAVDQVNGCMSFIPGSHLGEVLPHRSMNGDDRIHALECAGSFDVAEAVHCPMPAGGCTIHTSRTLHGAGPNKSERPRFAYVLVFHCPTKPAGSPKDHPWLVGKTTPRMNRRRAWMRHGGFLVHGWRRMKQIKHIGVRETYFRIVGKLRKALR